MGGVYIQGMKMPKGKEIVLRIDEKGEVYVYGSYPTKLHKAVPVPPHGRLIDESEIDLSKYEKAAHDALHNGKGSILYDSGVLAGARAITQLVRRAPTIIPATKEE